VPRFTDAVIDELILRFDRNAAERIVRASGFPAGEIPTGVADMTAFWADVRNKVEGGVFTRNADASPIVGQALELRPANDVFLDWRDGARNPPMDGRKDVKLERRATGFCVSAISDRTVQEVFDAAHRVLRLDQMQTPVELGIATDSFVALVFPTATSDQAVRISSRLAAELKLPPQHVTVRSNEFRDYFVDLNFEGPDQRRFAATAVPASTPVRDALRGVINGHYKDKNWPEDKSGKPREAVADKVTDDGKTERLVPDKSLHENGVRDGDTLQFASESRAGAINPILREEALARVQSQVASYAKGHPGFAALANSMRAATQYRLNFEAPSLEPPAGGGQPPGRIYRHQVLIELHQDFPMTAPVVVWQTPIFHPNINPKNGLVCLGALGEDRYRPGLDFAELCQMIVDIASYRNYEVREGYNLDAQKWACSDEGQVMIEELGGPSMLRMAFREYMDERQVPIPLRITPIE
jgi:ubiquitin-protein ligase